MRGRRSGRGHDRGAPVAIDSEAVRRTLEAHLEEMLSRRARLTAKPERGSGISFGKRIGDGTNEAVSRLTEVGVVDKLDTSIEQVRRALEKLDEGTYGSCDVCHAAIPAARLEARPESVVCVDHASVRR